MREKYLKQLENLNEELIVMGSLCETAISASIKGMLKDDDSKLQKALDADSEIDKKEREIESLCLKLLLQQQPVASDLRMISSALKIISDMERIGDQASDIAEITRSIKTDDIIEKTDLDVMARSVIKMVTDSVSSFVEKDIELARAVVIYDDTVDQLFDKIKRELISLVSKDKYNSEELLDALMIAKYLERIGDHAENIAQWVEYSITGQHED